MHPESPARVDAIVAKLSGAVQRGALSERVYESVKSQKNSVDYKYIDGDTYETAYTKKILKTTEVMIRDAVADLLAGRTRCSFVLCRPPGHHAYTSPGGFCHVNNVWTAVSYLRGAGISNIAIYDWDVHHGDGTEGHIEADSHGGVRFVSTHAFGRGIFPGTGDFKKTEKILNLPLRRGTGDELFLQTFQESVLPFLGKPSVLIVSAGYDAHTSDPMELMRLSTETYNKMAYTFHGLGIPVLFLLEGGYNPAVLAECVEATLQPWIIASVLDEAYSS